MLTPWKLEKESRRAAKWMLDKWMQNYGGANGTPFGWTPWALTAQNKDTQPVFAEHEAEQIFDHLRKNHLLKSREALLKFPDGRTAATSIVTFTDQIEVSRFIADNGVFTIWIGPMWHYLKEQRWFLLFIGVASFILASYFGALMTKLGERTAEYFWPSEQQKKLSP